MRRRRSPRARRSRDDARADPPPVHAAATRAGRRARAGSRTAGPRGHGARRYQTSARVHGDAGPPRPAGVGTLRHLYPSRITRRSLLSRSAAAASGLFLTSCFGRKVSTSPTPRPSYGPSPSVGGDPLADRPRRVPDDGEPELRQPLRPVPRRERGARTGVRAGQEVPAAAVPRVAAGRPGARHPRRGRPCYDGGKMDGFAIGDLRPGLRVHAVRRAGCPELLPLGGGVRAVRQLLRVGGRPVVPEPSVLHRGSGGRRDRQPREHPDEAAERRPRVQELGLRRLRRGRVRLHARAPTARSPSTRPCFDFETVGQQLSQPGIDWASYSADPYQAGYIWQAYSAIRRLRRPRSSGTSTSGRSTT